MSVHAFKNSHPIVPWSRSLLIRPPGFLIVLFGFVLLLSHPQLYGCESLQSPLPNSNKKVTTTTTATTIVQVCQHKDCCKRYGGTIDLVQTLTDLLPPHVPIIVESTGCLSECHRGPNLRVISSNNNGGPKENNPFIHDVSNAAMAAIQLEQIIQQSIPKLLLAAVQVMEKAQGKRNPPPPPPGGGGLYIVDDERPYGNKY